MKLTFVFLTDRGEHEGAGQSGLPFRRPHAHPDFTTRRWQIRLCIAKDNDPQHAWTHDPVRSVERRSTKSTSSLGQRSCPQVRYKKPLSTLFISIRICIQNEVSTAQNLYLILLTAFQEIRCGGE